MILGIIVCNRGRVLTLNWNARKTMRFSISAKSCSVSLTTKMVSGAKSAIWVIKMHNAVAAIMILCENACLLMVNAK